MFFCCRVLFCFVVQSSRSWKMLLLLKLNEKNCISRTLFSGKHLQTSWFESSAPWADLPPKLLGHIVDGLDLESYTRVRGTCPAWRRALAPVTLNPILLIVSDEKCLLSFRSTTYNYNSPCVGFSKGWITISIKRSCGSRAAHTIFVLLNPVTAAEIVLPPLMVKRGNWFWKVSKVVVAPNPSKDSFIAATICGVDRIAYVTAGATKWAVLEPIHLIEYGDHLVDLVYQDPGMVYCLTSRGDLYIHQLAVPREASLVQGSSGTSQQEFSSATILPIPIPVWHFRNYLSRISLSEVSDMFGTHYASEGSDLNTPLTLQPLLSRSSLPFHPDNAFLLSHMQHCPG